MRPLLSHIVLYIWVCCTPFIHGDDHIPDSSSSIGNLFDSSSHMTDKHIPGTNDTDEEKSEEQSWLYTQPNARSKRSYQRLIELLRGDLGRKMLRAYRENTLINNRMTRGMMFPSYSFSQRFVGTRGKRAPNDRERTDTKKEDGREDGIKSQDQEDQENTQQSIEESEMLPGSYDLIDDRNRRSLGDSESGEFNYYERPGLAFFGSRGKKPEGFGFSDHPEFLDYNEVDYPWLQREPDKKDLSNSFWGVRGKKILNNFRSPRQENNLDYMFFGTRGKKDDTSGLHEYEPNSDHQDGIDEDCCNGEKQKKAYPSQEFWGVRGKKQDFNMLFPERDSIDSGKAFWGVRGKKYYPGDEFWGIRGRRQDPGLGFWGARGKRYNSGQEFWGVRGKKYNPGQEFWGVRGKRYSPDQEFWGVRGKKNEPGQGFWGVRGKKYNPGQDFWGVRGKKYNPGQGFWGVRGKKYNPGQEFWGVRGKKYDPGQGFWGVRGKKLSDTEPETQVDLDRNGEDHIDASKRADLGHTFWGVRGKRPAENPSEAFWGVRGKKEDSGRMFWGARGKKDTAIPQTMFWGTRGKRDIITNSADENMIQNNLNSLIRRARDLRPLRKIIYPRYKFWEIKGKKIDPSRVFFGVRGKRQSSSR